jgi:hypothetical protein
MTHVDITASRATRSSFRTALIVLLGVVVMLAALASPALAQDDGTEPQPTADPGLVPNDPLAPQQDTEDDTTTASEPPPSPTAAAQPTQAPQDSGETETTTDTEEDNNGQVTSTVQRADAAAGPGFPAVLAHGLAFVTGDDVVWQVREVEPADADDARSDTSNAATLIQRDGSTVVRNDVTGKRAKLDVGEGYFRGAGDGYTVIAEDDDALLWHFELVDPDDVELDAFYEGPVVEGLDEGVYDMSMTRYVLGDNERVELPGNNGAGLVMVLSGEAEVSVDDRRSALGQGDGQTVGDGDVTVSNSGSADAVFVYVYLGDEVGDGSEGPAQGSAAQTGTSEVDSQPAGDDESTATETETEPAGDTVQAEAEADGDTADDEAADEADGTSGSVEAAPVDDAGNYITSIDVTADVELYLTITVDGLTVFDGTLPAGASTGPVVGSVFEVYTSYGNGTNFTNACGDYFKMGYEEGEAYYTLTATADSCAP